MGTRRPDRGEEPDRGETRGVRIVVLGGTRFIGRAIVEELVAAGHELLIVHRGVLEPEGMPPARHLHAGRAELPTHRAELAAFEPEAAIDCRALTHVDAQTALDSLPGGLRLVVISSLDVYRAFGALNEDRETIRSRSTRTRPSAASAIHIAASCPAWTTTTSSTSRTPTLRAAGRRCGCRWFMASTITSFARSTCSDASGPVAGGFRSAPGCGSPAAPTCATSRAAPGLRWSPAPPKVWRSTFARTAPSR